MTQPTETNAVEPSFDAIVIVTRDIEKWRAFYGDVVPLAESARETVPAGRFGPELLDPGAGAVEMVQLATPTGQICLLGLPDARIAAPVPVEGPGYTHFCIQSPANGPALPRLCRSGLEMVSWCDEHGVDLGGYGIRYAYGRDPESRMIEVEVLDRPQRPETGWIAHLANTVHDHARMLEFYECLLGLPPHRVFEQPAGRATFDAVAGIANVAVRGAWFRPSGFELEVWQYLAPPTPAPGRRKRLDTVGYGAALFAVDDLPTHTARLAAIGASPVGSGLALFDRETQFAADPEGNLFALQQR